MRALKYIYRKFRVRLLDLSNGLPGEVINEVDHRFSFRIYSSGEVVVSPVKPVIFPQFTETFLANSLMVRITDEGEKPIIEPYDVVVYYTITPGDSVMLPRKPIS